MWNFTNIHWKQQWLEQFTRFLSVWCKMSNKLQSTRFLGAPSRLLAYLIISFGLSLTSNHPAKVAFLTLQYTHHNHNEAIQRNDQSPEGCLFHFISLSLSLSLSLSIIYLYLSRPPPLSVCLCPLPTAVVSGFLNGSQDALWLCGGICACVCVCLSEGVCVWAARGDVVILTHERFSISG